jgi:hypothetical protein
MTPTRFKNSPLSETVLPAYALHMHRFERPDVSAHLHVRSFLSTGDSKSSIMAKPDSGGHLRLTNSGKEQQNGAYETTRLTAARTASTSSSEWAIEIYQRPSGSANTPSSNSARQKSL